MCTSWLGKGCIEEHLKSISLWYYLEPGPLILNWHGFKIYWLYCIDCFLTVNSFLNAGKRNPRPTYRIYESPFRIPVKVACMCPKKFPQKRCLSVVPEMQVWFICEIYEPALHPWCKTNYVDPTNSKDVFIWGRELRAIRSNNMPASTSRMTGSQEYVIFFLCMHR